MSFNTSSTTPLKLKKLVQSHFVTNSRLYLLLVAEPIIVFGCPPSQIRFFLATHILLLSIIVLFCFVLNLFLLWFLLSFSVLYYYLVIFLSTNLSGRVTLMNSILNRKSSYEKLNKEMTKI